MKLKCILILYIYTITAASSIVIKEVGLSDDKEYLSLQEDLNAVLECRFDLEEEESVKAVTWYHDDFKALFWGPPEPTKIGEGLKEGEAVLTREDGNLEFTSVVFGLEGKYRCEVMTSGGNTVRSPDYQLLIIDIPEMPDQVKHETDSCKIKFSWHAPAVKPKPNVMCGVWNSAHGYILTATKWMATPYYNGSIAYSLDDEEFEIPNMPLDAVIRCEIKITKVDNTDIQLMEKVYNFTEVWERGCPPLEVGDGVEVSYDNERLTCHAELRNKDESVPAMAHIKCKEGFLAKYQDLVTAVDMVCKDTKWDVAGGLTWNHFDNLLCVTKPKLPPTSESIAKKDSSSSEEEHEDSSSARSSIAPWIIISLLGITFFSGVVLSLKSSPKKKEARYMA